jgi:hypothetical protein
VQNRLNLCNECTCSYSDVELEFFTTNAPDPPYWTRNSSFGAFWTVSLQHELWCKTGRTAAITAQVCATTNAPDLAHWTLKWCFVAFLTISLLHELQCKTGNAQVRATKSRLNFLQRTLLINLIGPKSHVLGRLRLFLCCKNFHAKKVELVPFMHMFGQQSCIVIFRNKRTWSTPLDPKFKFWGVSGRFVTAWKSVQNGLNLCNKVTTDIFVTNAPDPSYWTPNSCFGAFRTVSLHHELRCKMGQTHTINAQVHATKSCQNFSQWSHPIHAIGPQTHVLEHLGLYVTAQTSVQNGLTWCR